MRSCKPIFLTTVALALALLATPGALQATAIEINSGPNIKTELLRGGNPAITVSFSFTLPDTATGDGLFEMFAGGDLNNLTDLVVVMAGVQSLGTLAFPINSANPALCNTNPAPAGCPVPEAVPGGGVSDGRPAVGDVEGRRDVTATNFGTAGLIVPESLLVGGSTLTFNLTADAGVYDLYIDTLDLSYPSATTVPEPGSLALLALSLLALVAFQNRARARGEQAQ
jgi:hypothetical protein